MTETAPIVAAPKHTPGPWRWEINRKHKSIKLCGGLPAGTFDKTVLDFQRYGMSGAAPVFHNWTADGWGGVPKRAHELAVEKAGREHHADWFALIDHPNAHLIAAAPELLAEHDIRVGDLVMLRKAVEAGDPKTELLFRIDDMLRETKAVIAKAEGRSNG